MVERKPIDSLGLENSWRDYLCIIPIPAIRQYAIVNTNIEIMIGVTSAGEGGLTYWRQHAHDRLVTTN